MIFFNFINFFLVLFHAQESPACTVLISCSGVHNLGPNMAINLIFHKYMPTKPLTLVIFGGIFCWNNGASRTELCSVQKIKSLKSHMQSTSSHCSIFSGLCSATSPMQHPPSCCCSLSLALATSSHLPDSTPTYFLFVNSPLDAECFSPPSKSDGI